MCAGLQETVNAGAMMKPFHAGWSAQCGVIAAQLAARGYVGPRSVFEGKRGFFRAYCGEGQYDVSIVDAGLGAEFDISMIMYKPYACAAASTRLDGDRAAARSPRLHGSRHRAPRCPDERERRGTLRDAARGEDRAASGSTRSTACHSRRQCCSSMASRSSTSSPTRAVRRPEVLELAARVHVEADSGLHSDDPEDEPAEVTVRLRNGQEHTLGGQKRARLARVPMTEQQLIDKYRLLATPVIRRACRRRRRDSCARPPQRGRRV